MTFDYIATRGQGWKVYRELTLVGLQGLPVPEDAMQDWYRMCDELNDEDLETATDQASDGSGQTRGQYTGAGAGSGS